MYHLIPTPSDFLQQNIGVNDRHYYSTAVPVIQHSTVAQYSNELNQACRRPKLWLKSFKLVAE
jgi:hypothetical protein